MTIDRQELDNAVARVNILMRAHVGAVDIADISPKGVVSLRFSGKCTGCELRPMTLAVTIKPALMRVAGVTDVIATGVRISEEAARRLAAIVPAGGRELRLPSDPVN